MDTNKVINIINSFSYPDFDALKYNKTLGASFSNSDLVEFTKIKENLIDDNNDLLIGIPLKSFNSHYIYYVYGHYLFELINNLKTSNYNHFSFDIHAEIAATLNIENINVDKNEVKEILISKKNCQHSQIVTNLYKGFNFIDSDPEFNRTNLHKLYEILTNGCLSEINKLPKGSLYRNGDVFIDSFEGAPIDKIDELMDSLFDFVNNVKVDEPYYLLLPHICHYYMVYVHPYFDFNGRMARMVSYWISRLFNIRLVPPFMSEEINKNKSKYYKALRNTRIAKNDLTYFLGFILECAQKK